MAKVERDLSTKKLRDWWKAVEEAASRAPKLEVGKPRKHKSIAIESI